MDSFYAFGRYQKLSQQPLQLSGIASAYEKGKLGKKRKKDGSDSKQKTNRNLYDDLLAESGEGTSYRKSTLRQILTKDDDERSAASQRGLRTRNPPLRRTFAKKRLLIRGTKKKDHAESYRVASGFRLRRGNVTRRGKLGTEQKVVEGVPESGGSQTFGRPSVLGSLMNWGPP